MEAVTLNRKLHENRELSIAVGEWLASNEGIPADEGMLECISNVEFFIIDGTPSTECTIIDDYNFSEHVMTRYRQLTETENEK